MGSMQAYLASGWFNENQMRIMNKIRDIILEFPEINLFSPYYDGIVLTKDNDSPEMRRKVFDLDIGTIAFCDLLVAAIDDFEPGTMVELGAAALLCWLIDNKYKLSYKSEFLYNVPQIIAYTNVSGRGLNVMLQQATWGFANGEEQLREQLRRFVNKEKPIDYLSFKRGDFV